MSRDVKVFLWQFLTSFLSVLKCKCMLTNYVRTYTDVYMYVYFVYLYCTHFMHCCCWMARMNWLVKGRNEVVPRRYILVTKLTLCFTVAVVAASLVVLNACILMATFSYFCKTRKKV